MPPDLAQDQADLHALQQGEATALNRLMLRWHRPLHHFAFRYVQNTADAHDLVLETFIHPYQHSGRLSPDMKLGAWLFSTLANLYHNHNRGRRSPPTVSMEVPARVEAESHDSKRELLSDRTSPDAAPVHTEAATAVRAAID